MTSMQVEAGTPDMAGSYTAHRQRLVMQSIVPAVLVSFGATLLYAVADGVHGGDWGRAFSAACLVQLAAPLIMGGLVLGPLRERAEIGALTGDLVFTAAIAARLLDPVTTVSGTALFLSLKMLATALFLPWAAAVQVLSAAATMALYFGILLGARGAPDATAAGLHQVFGPIIAALLACGGALVADRTRHALFIRDRELAGEVQVSSALARTGQEIIGPFEGRETLLRKLCAVTVEAVGCDASVALLWDESRRAFLPVAGRGFSETDWGAFRSLLIGPEVLAAPLAALHTDDVTRVTPADLADAGWRSIATELGITSGLLVPLRRGSEVVGLHSACYRNRVADFSTRQERIAAGIGRIAGLALENARLLQEMARTGRAKSEFVATVSHELRSPLNVIVGYSRLLLDDAFGRLSDEQLDPVKRVERSAYELLELVTTTLDLSRADSGHVRLDLRETLVDDLVRDLEAETQEARDKPGLRFSWHMPPGLPRLWTDPFKLKVVLKNLILNAIKFTDEGSVSVEAAERDGGIELRVVDTGIGMSAETLAHIFEPFRQEGGRSGFGLGLYIVRRLLEVLGGRVSVESTPGEGSTFRVWIPPRCPERAELVERKASSPEVRV